MPNIYIKIKNKVAYADNDQVIVGGNKDYKAIFEFDNEWNEILTKTARFSWGDKTHDEIFTGNECDIPRITNTNSLKVGIFVGNERATTDVIIPCKISTVDNNGMPPNPEDDIYSQILEKLDQAIGEQTAVPEGGKKGQFLGKASDKDYDTEWQDVNTEVDSELSLESENAVQNKVITEELNKKSSVEYVNEKFNGANKAVSFFNYSLMISSLNSLPSTSYSVGQNVMIVVLQVPDLWISEITETSVPYTYVSDTDFVSELEANGFVQVGYFKLSALETQKVDLEDYVKNTDYATSTTAGIAKFGEGLTFWGDGQGVAVRFAGTSQILNQTGGSVVGTHQVAKTTKQALINPDLKEATAANWTNDERKQAQNTLGFLTGEGEPTITTEGYVGQIYTDITTGTSYQCTEITEGAYTWVKIINENDKATSSGNFGLIRIVGTGNGLEIQNDGRLSIRYARENDLTAKKNNSAVTAYNISGAVKEGLIDPNGGYIKGDWTDEERALARATLGIMGDGSGLCEHHLTLSGALVGNVIAYSKEPTTFTNLYDMVNNSVYIRNDNAPLLDSQIIKNYSLIGVYYYGGPEEREFIVCDENSSVARINFNEVTLESDTVQ